MEPRMLTKNAWSWSQLAQSLISSCDVLYNDDQQLVFSSLIVASAATFTMTRELG